MRNYSNISDRSIFTAGALVIFMYLITALYAMYFSVQNIRQVRAENIKNEGRITQEMLQHEFHNLLEIPRQTHFFIENSLQKSGNITPENLEPLKNILKENDAFENVAVVSPDQKVLILKGTVPNIIKPNEKEPFEILPPEILRYKDSTEKYTLIYDISLGHFISHLKGNRLGMDNRAIITLPNGQILFSTNQQDLGKIFNSKEKFDWQGNISAEGTKPMKLYLNFSPEFLEKGSAKVSKILLIVSSAAFLVLVLLYFFYSKTIKKERTKSSELSAKNEKLLLENERRLKENALLQLQQIKEQINPHFLFNSLNSLKTLIDIQSPNSNEFLQKLSDVYRYVLKNRDESLVEISEEMRFVEEYFYLQKIRFGSALEMQISGKFEKGRLPFLALQTLIENAIKHNIASKKEPLKIEISAGESSVLVKNKINLRRNSGAESTGIGLEYLRNSYLFYGRQDFSFGEENGFFVVNLPLIKEKL